MTIRVLAALFLPGFGGDFGCSFVFLAVSSGTGADAESGRSSGQNVILDRRLQSEDDLGRSTVNPTGTSAKEGTKWD